VNYVLSDEEARVLGALIEKELTTPDYYPLSLNSLMTACNQTSNRNPVMHFTESECAEAAEHLREKNLAHRVDRGESRVVKYRHVVYETLNLRRPSVAIIAVLLLRGAQTVAEIRTRTNRLYDFSSIEEVETTLDSLMTREPALVVRMARQIGQKEIRFAHLLCGEPVAVAAAVEADDASPPPRPNSQNEERIERLEREVENLKAQFEQFRRQFE